MDEQPFSQDYRVFFVYYYYSIYSIIQFKMEFRSQGKLPYFLLQWFTTHDYKHRRWNRILHHRWNFRPVTGNYQMWAQRWILVLALAPLHRRQCPLAPRAVAPVFWECTPVPLRHRFLGCAVGAPDRLGLYQISMYNSNILKINCHQAGHAAARIFDLRQFFKNSRRRSGV